MPKVKFIYKTEFMKKWSELYIKELTNSTPVSRLNLSITCPKCRCKTTVVFEHGAILGAVVGDVLVRDINCSSCLADIRVEHRVTKLPEE